MKQKKLLALSLVLVLLLSLFAVAPASAVTDQVSLIYAKPILGSMYVSAAGYVEVDKLGTDKAVTIHYSADGTTWHDVAATYFKDTQANKEAWQFLTDQIYVGLRGNATIQFAVKYEVNGQTYWDNNNGLNYSVKAGYGVTNQYDFGNGGLANWYTSKAYQGTITHLQLKDMGYDKDVRIRYTTDNWATYKEVQGYYVSKFADSYVEQWEVYVPVETAFEYALSYTVNGVTYWDNNFGQNYTFVPAA